MAVENRFARVRVVLHGSTAASLEAAGVTGRVGLMILFPSIAASSHSPSYGKQETLA